MTSFVFTKEAKKLFQKLEASVRYRIEEKLRELQGFHDERSISMLHDAAPATHRLRVGDYRLILSRKDDDSFFIIDVGHRSSIYR